MSKQHHYSYGSGQPGCLYDWGPNYSETLAGAIESCAWMFGQELTDAELKRMRSNLRVEGIHYFNDPATVGATYVEICKQPGPCPAEDE